MCVRAGKGGVWEGEGRAAWTPNWTNLALPAICWAGYTHHTAHPEKAAAGRGSESDAQQVSNGLPEVQRTAKNRSRVVRRAWRECGIGCGVPMCHGDDGSGGQPARWGRGLYMGCASGPVRLAAGGGWEHTERQEQLKRAAGRAGLERD